MSQAYDREFLQQARQIANSHNIHLHEGIYLANQGPSYETPPNTACTVCSEPTP